VITWPCQILVGAAAVISPTPALGSPLHRCGVPEQLHQLRDRIRVHPPIPTLAGPEKLTRDGFAGPYSVRESENFAVKWQSAQVSEADAQLVLDSLELAWSTYVLEWGHRTPIGGDTYRVNAYIATENDTPSIAYGGYASLDDEGFPYLVMSARALNASAAIVTHLAVHEFYHDIQFSRQSYYSEVAYWYWEATASWASQEVQPNELTPYYSIGMYALAGELPINFMGDPHSDGFLGSHHYGASLFPLYLTDRFDDLSIVVDTWENAAVDGDPLADLDVRLGGELASAFSDFSARNATWDHERREFITPWIEWWSDEYDVSPIALKVGPAGTDWVAIERAPHPYGYVTIEIERPAAPMQIEVEADLAPAADLQPMLHATLVRVHGGTATYVPVVSRGGSVTTALDLPADEPTAYLSLAVTTAARGDRTIPTRLRVAPESSGCRAAGGEGPGLALLMVAALVVRRDRQRTSRRRWTR